ncbi:MAG: hypothetical protein R2747_23155 [Pyrinomonadaceae bacterium]
MTNTKSNQFLTSAKTLVVTIAMILTVLTGAALADNINLDMQGSTATVPKGNTVDRNIYGLPTGIPGTLKLKMKWHAVNIIPNTFNRLKIQVLHGSTVLKTTNCYSLHSNKSPKCNFTMSVSQTEANKAGTWKLRITNNSNFEVTEFNIEKGNDINPFVPSFKSIYTPNCPSTVNLDMEGTTLTLTKGSTQYRKIYGIGKSAGVLRLKAKWHAVNILPTYNKLTVQLIKPNGQIAKSGSYYSIHSNKSPKLNYTYNISASDAALPGNWKLKITNNSNFEVTGFNIEKESGEINPLVPNFFSSYKANCSF